MYDDLVGILLRRLRFHFTAVEWESDLKRRGVLAFYGTETGYSRSKYSVHLHTDSVFTLIISAYRPNTAVEKEFGDKVPSLLEIEKLIETFKTLEAM